MKRAALLVLIASLLVSSSCGMSADSGTLEAFVDRWKVLYNSHDLAGFASLYAPKGAYMAPGMVYFETDRGALRKGIEHVWRNYPDAQIAEIYSIVRDSDGDKIAFAWRLTRTAPSGKLEVLLGSSFLTVEDALVVQQLTMTAR